VSGNTDAGRTVTNKVIAILLAFANGGEYSLSEIARLTTLPVSTAHRLMCELAALDILDRGTDGRYRVGARLRAIRNEPGPPPTKHECARRVLEDLAAAYSWATIRLGVLENSQVTYIEKSSPVKPVSMSFENTPLPAHATAMGKVLLAFAAPKTVAQVVSLGLPRYTEFTLTSPAQLNKTLSTVRLAGEALARREIDLTTYAIAVPVLCAGGQPLAALELTGSRARDIRMARPGLIVAARILSRDLQANHQPSALIIGPERQLDIIIGAAGTELRRQAGTCRRRATSQLG
jgi:IclR family acetate operon transcriptional repressor